jgi:hypothetical protein
MFPVLNDHEKAFIDKVKSAKVSAELCFPGVLMTDSTTAKVNQIKRKLSITGFGICAF